MKGGEIFVPKIPSMKIMDFADVIAPQAKRKIIGIRPGEKLHEVLLTAEESRNAKEFDDHYVIQPELSFWNSEHYKDAKALPASFVYSSDNNTQWLSREQIQNL